MDAHDKIIGSHIPSVVGGVSRQGVAFRLGRGPSHDRSAIESAELLMSYHVNPYAPRLLDVPTQVKPPPEAGLRMRPVMIAAYSSRARRRRLACC
jgi:hypothetical protein